MTPRSLALLSITFIAGVVFLLFAVSLRPVWTPQTAREQGETTRSLTAPSVTYVHPKKGATEPKLVLVEFGDFQCTACKEFAETLDVLLRTIPEVQIVWRNMPNDSTHPSATQAAVAAHCAGEQGMFWEYHDALFDRQAALAESVFSDIAASLALKREPFDRCVQNRATLPLVQKDTEEALALGIPATPAFYIGEESYVGAMDINELLEIVRQKLAGTSEKVMDFR